MEEINHWELRHKFVEVLSKDVEKNFEVMQLDSSNLSRRNYVRSLFALYEAVLANLREAIAAKLVSNGFLEGSHNLHEIYPLMDEAASISESGSITKKYNQIPFKNSVKYVLKLFCREYYITDDIFNQGWKDFQSSIQIRHKITHPKYESDISITEEDLRVIESGKNWWDRTLSTFKYKADI